MRRQQFPRTEPEGRVRWRDPGRRCQSLPGFCCCCCLSRALRCQSLPGSTAAVSRALRSQSLPGSAAAAAAVSAGCCGWCLRALPLVSAGDAACLRRAVAGSLPGAVAAFPGCRHWSLPWLPLVYPAVLLGGAATPMTITLPGRLQHPMREADPAAGNPDSRASDQRGFGPRADRRANLSGTSACPVPRVRYRIFCAIGECAADPLSTSCSQQPVAADGRRRGARSTAWLAIGRPRC